MSDKTVAELMALADAYAGQAYLRRPEGSGIEQARRAALEQAIRCAVDWGPVRAYLREYKVGGEPFSHAVVLEQRDVVWDDGCIETPLYARNKP